MAAWWRRKSGVAATKKEAKNPRPVILLGPLKDRINDSLMSEYSDKFDSCVPHTSRKRRENEVDGREYHFVSSREKMEDDIRKMLYIEAGQLNNDLYGTTVSSVKDIGEIGKHCLLDVKSKAIKRLHEAEIYPITVLIQPKSVQSIMELDVGITEEQARKTYKLAMELKEECREYITAYVEGDTYNEIYTKVKQIIQDHSSLTNWVLSKEQL